MSLDYSVLDPIELEVIEYVLRKEAGTEVSTLRKKTVPLKAGFCGPYLGLVEQRLPPYLATDFANRNRTSIVLPEEALPGSNWEFWLENDTENTIILGEDARQGLPLASEDDKLESIGFPREHDFGSPGPPVYAVSRPAIWWDRRAALIFIQWDGGSDGIRSDYILLNYQARLRRWNRLRRFVGGLT